MTIESQSQSGWLLEIVLYNGQRMQSETYWRENLHRESERRYISGLEIVLELRRLTMVESVRGIAIHTGEVLFELASYTAAESFLRDQPQAA